MAENFDLIFGRNASQQYAWNDTDYQNGWETIGNIPPTAAQFDALQRRSDTKMKELNDELTPLVNADTADSRQPSTAYSVDDIKYSPLLPTGWFLTCTVAGTTSAGELILPTPIAENTTVTDGTVKWTVRKPANKADIPSLSGYATKSYVDSKVGSATPAGTIVAYGGSGTPTGWLLCDGSDVSRSTYSSLYSAIGTTWGSGNGSTTFNLPNLIDKWTKGSATAGTDVSAGLPNITGTIGDMFGNRDDFVKTGVFSGSGTPPATSTRPTGTNTGGPFTVNFSAKNSNSLYGASSTVSVSSKTVRFIIKY